MTLLGGFGFSVMLFCVFAIATILGQNAIYNGMESATISTATFVLSYLGFRWLLRDKGKFFYCFKDEAFMAAVLYIGIFLAGMIAISFFGDKTPNDNSEVSV